MSDPPPIHVLCILVARPSRPLSFFRAISNFLYFSKISAAFFPEPLRRSIKRTFPLPLVGYTLPTNPGIFFPPIKPFFCLFLGYRACIAFGGGGVDSLLLISRVPPDPQEYQILVGKLEDQVRRQPGFLLQVWPLPPPRAPPPPCPTPRGALEGCLRGAQGVPCPTPMGAPEAEGVDPEGGGGVVEGLVLGGHRADESMCLPIGLGSGSTDARVLCVVQRGEVDSASSSSPPGALIRAFRVHQGVRGHSFFPLVQSYTGSLCIPLFDCFLVSHFSHFIPFPNIFIKDGLVHFFLIFSPPCFRQILSSVLPYFYSIMPYIGMVHLTRFSIEV